MTRRHKETTPSEDPINLFLEHGLSDGPPQIAEMLMNAAMLIERSARKRLRTSNACETLNTQIKRRTRVAGLFLNTDSILRLVTAILMEISEEWETGKAYLTTEI